jgi:hypothetical protein
MRIMNIFFLHFDPKTCAQMHCDKHIVKMALETSQLLCGAHHMTMKSTVYKPEYKLSHKNHPCSKWVRTSLSNYKWLCELGIEICMEYTYRYGKIHKCQKIIEDLSKNLPDIEDIGFIQPYQAMPDVYKDEDSVEAYRQYYIFEKNHIHSWKKRKIPDFIQEAYDLIGKENLIKH